MSQRDEITELLDQNKRRLHQLKLQEARYGFSTPPHVLMEIEDLEKAIMKLEQELARVKSVSLPPQVAQMDNPELPTRSLRVFLSHASEDKPQVREVYRKLVTQGIDAWLDEEKLVPGQDWKLEISRAVRLSDVVLVFLSTEAVSKAGYVQKEIKQALDVADEQPEGAIFLIPVKLESCDVPDRLNHVQWVNLFEDRGWDRLLSALRQRAQELNIALK